MADYGALSPHFLAIGGVYAGRWGGHGEAWRALAHPSGYREGRKEVRAALHRPPRVEGGEERVILP